MKKLLSLLLLVFLCQPATGQLMSPAEFLGYETGDRLTPHHRVVAYYEHVAENSDRVTLQHYGETYGHRTLIAAFVTSPENHERLDEIRENNLRHAGLLDGEPQGDSKAIVWLSYNVHGNEISGTEAAMLTIYELAQHDNDETAAWLENTVVVMDPLLNPDGRDRYVNWFHQVAGRKYDPYPTTREHNEPWPNARTNYYQFDLNRDWAWQIQKETQQRIALYHKWMPHVHADFHEMGIDSPYYFAPAAEPFHVAISDWQREFQETIGRNHADYFDRNFRIYYTRERFDLFYPSYGDTYPTFNGAIGMTYEQAGNTRGGLSVITAEGDTLTFEQRILNQHVVGLSTVEITAQHADRVISEFRGFFGESQRNPYAEYKTYIFPGTNHPDKLDLLTSYLDKWDISYGRAPSRRNVSALNYTTSETGRISLSGDDLVISAYQPKSVLLNVLFEPKTTVVDSVTYDITAWAVPYAMGLEAWASTDRINPSGQWSSPSSFASAERVAPDSKPYAYAAPWNSFEDARYLAQLLQENVRVRIATNSFELEGHSFERGALLMTRRGNENLGERFDEIVQELAYKLGRSVKALQTGMVDAGIDLGSNQFRKVSAPKIALLAGEGLNPNNFGEIWHYFDHQLEYPVHIFNHSNLNQINWNDFDVLILPEGGYGSVLNDRIVSRIQLWASEGGRIITMGSSVTAFSGKEGFPQLTSKSGEESSGPNLIRYEDRSRNAISDFIGGSIYRLHLDNSHPMAYGYPEYYFSLKRGTSSYEFLENGWNVATLREGAHRSGFEGYRAAEVVQNSMIFGTQSIGRGDIVYMVDNPLFRGFWHNGKLLFANAVFGSW